MTYRFIDTHAHLDGTEYDADREETILRAREAGVSHVLIPAIHLPSMQTVTDLCRRFPGYALPMVGLHPEEVKDDWREVLQEMRRWLDARDEYGFVAIGEVGLDYYWSREYEAQQLQAFEQQVQWAVETQLPLAIHCRKAQNEMVALMKPYADRLKGGVFHCFTGNAREAEQLLTAFPQFVLGIGGVLTFKKSHLPETLAEAVPLERIVVETDAPYMAPVPLRGQRNESAFARHVVERLAQCYGVTEEEVARVTTENARRVFPAIPQ